MKTAKDVAFLTNLSIPTVMKYLKRLSEEGKIKIKIEKKATKTFYFLNDEDAKKLIEFLKS